MKYNSASNSADLSPTLTEEVIRWVRFGALVGGTALALFGISKIDIKSSDDSGTPTIQQTNRSNPSVDQTESKFNLSK